MANAAAHARWPFKHSFGYQYKSMPGFKEPEKQSSALAVMLLRIDDAFFAKRTKEEKPPEKPGPEEGWEEEPH